MNWIEHAQKRPAVVLFTLLVGAGASGYQVADVTNKKRIELITEKVAFQEDKNRHLQTQIDALQRDLGQRDAELEILQLAAQRKNFAGYWTHSWGRLSLTQENEHIIGILLDFNGKSYILTGTVQDRKFSFDWFRYQGGVIASQNKGELTLAAGDDKMTGVWIDAEGVRISVAAERFRLSSADG